MVTYLMPFFTDLLDDFDMSPSCFGRNKKGGMNIVLNQH